MNDLSTIYSYGGGEVLFYIFNAIAMLFNGGFVKGIFDFVIVVALIWAGFKSATIKDAPRVYVRLFMSYLVVWVLIIQPIGSGTTLHIRDVVTKKPIQPVNNLPPALVLPASIISGLGYNITKAFEMVFNSPSGALNYLEYHKYGTMFGAQVISELRNFKIQNPVFRENMENYISNCMMYDVMIGKKYDIQDLRSSTDILQLLTENASTLRMVNFRNDKHQGREMINCKQAISRISQSFQEEPNFLAQKFPIFAQITGTSPSTGTSIAQNTALGNGLIKALELSTNFYGNMGTSSAQEKLKQILIINAFKDKPDSYGTIRAAQNQNTAWSLSGEMAKQTLPIMHAVFEALIYALFPIVACMLFFPGGYKAIGSYFGMLIWIQLWPPLFAVLNLIVSIFAKLSNGTGAITVQSIEDIVSSQSSYAMAASSLGMLVPVLSYMIIKGGAGQFVHIASQVTGSTNAGVSTATHELTSGNRSMDNINIGDRSSYNTRANKFDTSGHIESGFMRQRNSDGSYQTDLANGETIFQSGPGTTKSTGTMSIQALKSSGDSYRTQAQAYRSISENASNELSHTSQQMERKSIDYVARMAESQARGESHEISDTTSDGRTLQNVISKAKDLHENYGYGWQQASEKAMSGNFSIKGNVEGKMGNINTPGPSASIGGSAEGNINVRGAFSNTDNQNLSEGNSSSNKDDYSKNIDLVSRASKNQNYNESQSKEKALAESLGSLHEKSIQQRETIAENDAKSVQAQRSYEKINSFTSNVSMDEYHNILNYVANKLDPQFEGYRIGHHKAHKIMENNPEQAMKYIDEWQGRKEDHQKMYGYSPETQKDINKLNKVSNDLKGGDVDVSYGEVKGQFQDLDNTSQFKDKTQKEHFKDFNAGGDDIKLKHNTEKKKANTSLDAQKMRIKEEELRLKREVNIAENNKGYIAKTLNIGRNKPHSDSTDKK